MSRKMTETDKNVQVLTALLQRYLINHSRLFAVGGMAVLCECQLCVQSRIALDRIAPAEWTPAQRTEDIGLFRLLYLGAKVSLSVKVKEIAQKSTGR